MLRGWGLMPDAARDVPVALTKLHQAATADKPFVLVVADAVMPQIDGYTLAGWIRNEPQLAGGIVLMVPPGDAFAVKRCQELGAGHLERPMAQAELLDAIVKLLGDASRAGPAPVAAPRRSPRAHAAHPLGRRHAGQSQSRHAHLGKARPPRRGRRQRRRLRCSV